MEINFSPQEQIKFLERLGYKHFTKLQERSRNTYHDNVEYYDVKVDVVEKNFSGVTSRLYLEDAFKMELKYKLLNL